jgi:hypothetical protein
MHVLRRWCSFRGLAQADTISSILMVGLMNVHVSHTAVVLAAASFIALHFALLELVCWMRSYPRALVRRLYQTDLVICAVGLLSAAVLPSAGFVAVCALLHPVHWHVLSGLIRSLDAESILDAVHAYHQRACQPQPAARAPRKTARR